MDLATSLVHEHFANVVLKHVDRFRYPRSDYRTSPTEQPTLRRGCNGFHVKVHYVVTSIKEIQCFTNVHSKHETTMACTPVETFFPGTGPPSETGVRWLLSTIYRYEYPVHTRIHDLPIELLEMIVDYAFPSNDNSIFDRALFAAQLGICKSFNFQKLKHPFTTCDFCYERKMNTSHPEYQIRIWKEYVGMSYQLDDGSEKSELGPCRRCYNRVEYMEMRGRETKCKFDPVTFGPAV